MNRIVCLMLLSCTTNLMSAADEEATAAALTERFNRESVPVWANGDVLTFYFRGEAESVQLFAGGEIKSLERIPSSDVWTVTLTLPELERGVISYFITPKSSGASAGRSAPQKGVWCGGKAPAQAVGAAELAGR